MEKQNQIRNGALIIIISIVFFYVIAIDFNPRDGIFFLLINLCLLISGIAHLRDGIIESSQSRKNK